MRNSLVPGPQCAVRVRALLICPVRLDLKNPASCKKDELTCFGNNLNEVPRSNGDTLPTQEATFSRKTYIHMFTDNIFFQILSTNMHEQKHIFNVFLLYLQHQFIDIKA